MPMSVDPMTIQSLRRQHLNAADKLAQRIINCATAVRMHIANGQPAGPAARQIGSDVMELVAELAKLGEDDKLMGWVRQPAA